MEGVLHGLQGIFEVLFIISIGFILAKKGWFGPDMSAVFTKLVMKISLPLYMLCQLEKDFTHDSLLRIAPDLFLPFASILLAYAVGRIAAKVLHIRQTGRASSSLVFHCQYHLHRPARQPGPVRDAERTVGHALLHGQHDHVLDSRRLPYRQRQSGRQGNMPLFSLQTLKKVFSPPLLGFWLAWS